MQAFVMRCLVRVVRPEFICRVEIIPCLHILNRVPLAHAAWHTDQVCPGVYCNRRFCCCKQLCARIVRIRVYFALVKQTILRHSCGSSAGGLGIFATLVGLVHPAVSGDRDVRDKYRLYSHGFVRSWGLWLLKKA